MSINSEIERISTAKTNIKNAITSKGISVPEDTKIDSYYLFINQIQSYSNYQFNFDSSTWEENLSTTSNFNKYKKTFDLPSGMTSDSKIISYVQVPYDSNNFLENEFDACYYWSEIEVTDSNIIFYSSENISINFSIILYYK